MKFTSRLLKAFQILTKGETEEEFQNKNQFPEDRSTGDMINLPRGYGKSTFILRTVSKRNNKNDAILVKDMNRGRSLKQLSDTMGLKRYPTIITIDDWISGRYNSNRLGNVYVEDIDSIMEHILRSRIELITISRKNIF